MGVVLSQNEYIRHPFYNLPSLLLLPLTLCRDILPIMNIPDNVDRNSIITLDGILDDVPRDRRIHNWISEQCRFAVTEHSPSLSHTQHLHSDSLSSIESTIPAIRADSPLLGFPSASECDASHDPLHFPSPTYARDLPELEPVVEVVQHSPHETEERRIENLVKTLSVDKV